MFVKNLQTKQLQVIGLFLLIPFFIISCGNQQTSQPIIDIDWQWIDYIMEKDGMISVNPDAHSVAGISDTKFGIIAARKGGLTTAGCLNTKSLEQFEQWLSSR